MTDTVNVPREPTREMLKACLDAMKADKFSSPKRIWSAMLAAAPKAEPVSYHHELEAALQDAKRAVAFFDQVRAATQAEQIAVGTDHHKWLQSSIRTLAAFADQPLSNPQQLEAQPEAQKVEQEPLCDHGHLDAMSACSQCDAAEITHPAPSSDELLEGLGVLVDRWDNDEIGTVSLVGAVRDIIAKHKGPQS